MDRYIAFDVETPNHFNNRMSAIGISVIEDGKNISYSARTYEQDPSMTGEEIAAILGEDAELYDTIFVSAGKLGHQIEIAAEDLIAAADCKTADLIKADL